MEEYHAFLLSLKNLCEEISLIMQQKIKIEGPHRITYGFFSKAIQTIKAIALLYENNLNEEAQSLVRIVFETKVNFFMFLSMMSEAPKSTFGRVLDSMMIEKIKQQRASNFVGLDLVPEAPTREKLLQCEEEIKSRYPESEFRKLKQYGFTGINLEQCAIKTGDKEAYNIIYRNFSRNIHATDYMEFSIRQSPGLTRTGPSYLESRNRISYQVAIGSLTSIAEAINRVFRLGRTREINQYKSKWIQCLGHQKAER